MSNPSLSPVPMGTRALSPSKIATLQCPYRYRALYVLDEPPQAAEATQLALGTLVHEVAATYVRHLRDTKRATDLSALAGYAAVAWRLRPHTIPESCSDDFGLFMYQLEQVIFEPETIVDVELRLAFRADWSLADWEDADVLWGGMLDVLGIKAEGEDAQAYMRDWTTAAISGQFAAKKDLQLRHYGLLVSKAYKIHRVSITTHSLRTGATREVELDEYDHAETEKRLLEESGRLDRLLAGDPRFDWPAIPNSECAICTLKCPAYEAAKLTDAPLRIDGPAEALAVMQEFTLLEVKRKALAKLLKAHVTFHGAVTGGGMEAAIRTIEKRTYPTQEVVGKLRGGNLDPWLAVKVDRTQLKKVTKKDHDLFLEIDALATIKKGERFGVKALGLDEDEGEGE